MDPDQDQDPKPPFFSEFKDEKKSFFIFFSYNLPAGASVLKT
jgi:hypothetical protein